MKQVLIKTGKHTSMLTSYDSRKQKVAWIRGKQEIVSVKYEQR